MIHRDYPIFNKSHLYLHFKKLLRLFLFFRFLSTESLNTGKKLLRLLLSLNFVSEFTAVQKLIKRDNEINETPL